VTQTDTTETGETAGAWPPAPHDPREREVVGRVGAWEIRQFPPSDPKLAYFGGRGFLHIQLWHPERGVSILTPSRLTGGRFDVWTEDGCWLSLARWQTVAASLPDVTTPGPLEVEAIERWFVLRHEPAEIHLLRVWWASLPRARKA
jgi:hypothetical protein